MKLKFFSNLWNLIFLTGIFSFNSHVYYLTRGFIASTRASDLLTCACNLSIREIGLLTCGFEFVTHGFEFVIRGIELVTRGIELLTRGFELVTRKFELATRISELVTRVLLFHKLFI